MGFSFSCIDHKIQDYVVAIPQTIFQTSILGNNAVNFNVNCDIYQNR